MAGISADSTGVSNVLVFESSTSGILVYTARCGKLSREWSAVHSERAGSVWELSRPRGFPGSNDRLWVAMNGQDVHRFNCIFRRFKRLGVRVDYVPALCTHRPLWEALPGVAHSALGTSGEGLGTTYVVRTYRRVRIISHGRAPLHPRRRGGWAYNTYFHAIGCSISPPTNYVFT